LYPLNKRFYGVLFIECRNNDGELQDIPREISTMQGKNIEGWEFSKTVRRYTSVIDWIRSHRLGELLQRVKAQEWNEIKT